MSLRPPGSHLVTGKLFEVSMPESVIYTHLNKTYTVNFNSFQAGLPVKLKTGEIKIVKWGRREEEGGEMPLGGWAKLSLIKDDNCRWNMYSPKPVKIYIEKFMEKDHQGRPCWYEVTKGKCLQGLLAKHENEYRLYIVMIDPQELLSNHYRWPQIVNCELKKV